MTQTDRILVYLRWYVDSYGYGPTLDEVAGACGLSGKSHAWHHPERARRLGLAVNVQRYRGRRAL